ncbi:hypothetical protein GOODEAATRI_030359 [Goodea atripinnis]|uniref:Uncharacterized protein n=1 Tax=Goodea atripinnis TaxID=208336 RepID=A0ABV0MWE7_9TELE
MLPTLLWIFWDKKQSNMLVFLNLLQLQQFSTLKLLQGKSEGKWNLRIQEMLKLHVSQLSFMFAFMCPSRKLLLSLCVLQQHHLLSKPTNCSHQSFMFASGSVL